MKKKIVTICMLFAFCFMFSVEAKATWYPNYSTFRVRYVNVACPRCGIETPQLANITRYATPLMPGEVYFHCGNVNCNYSWSDLFAWAYQGYDQGYEPEYDNLYNPPCYRVNTCYDVYDHSLVFKYSKYITLYVPNTLKGSVVKLKIGKRTYTKKITSTAQNVKIKFKIKKPKYGEKIRVRIYYNGMLIGQDRCGVYYGEWDDGVYYNPDVVYYSKIPKKGMKKKMVKYVYKFALPYEVSGSSRGWSHFDYADGSKITFKNGRVYSWYIWK